MLHFPDSDNNERIHCRLFAMLAGTFYLLFAFSDSSDMLARYLFSVIIFRDL